ADDPVRGPDRGGVGEGPHRAAQGRRGRPRAAGLGGRPPARDPAGNARALPGSPRGHRRSELRDPRRAPVGRSGPRLDTPSLSWYTCIVPIYRTDISKRDDDARTRDPGAPEGTTDARLPALSGALRPARGALEGLVRLAVPNPAATRAGRRGRAGPGDRGRPHPQAPRRPHHPRGGTDVPSAPGGAAVGHPGRGHAVPDPADLLPVPAARDTDPAPRPASLGARGATRRDQRGDRG